MQIARPAAAIGGSDRDGGHEEGSDAWQRPGHHLPSSTCRATCRATLAVFCRL